MAQLWHGPDETWPELDICVRKETTASCVRLAGELDMATAARLRDVLVALARDGHSTVEVDLSALDFADVVGVRALVAAHRALCDAGGDLVVRGAAPIVRRLLKISGYDKIINVQ